MQYDHITTDSQLKKLCQALADSSYIGFDTEFVSEDTYFPELCLVQVAADDVLAVIDPQEINDMSPFWETLSTGSHCTIAHAEREEFRFCRLAVQRRPANLFDVQLAAGLVGIEYPASYGKLLTKLLSVRLAKGETRTDWRRRPLSDKQIDYALQDVIYLKDIHSKIESKLKQLGRLERLQEEMTVWQDEMEAAEIAVPWQVFPWGLSFLAPVATLAMALTDQVGWFPTNQGLVKSCWLLIVVTVTMLPLTVLMLICWSTVP